MKYNVVSQSKFNDLWVRLPFAHQRIDDISPMGRLGYLSAPMADGTGFVISNGDGVVMSPQMLKDAEGCGVDLVDALENPVGEKEPVAA